MGTDEGSRKFATMVVKERIRCGEITEPTFIECNERNSGL